MKNKCVVAESLASHGLSTTREVTSFAQFSNDKIF